MPGTFSRVNHHDEVAVHKLIHGQLPVPILVQAVKDVFCTCLRTPALAHLQMANNFKNVHNWCNFCGKNNASNKISSRFNTLRLDGRNEVTQSTSEQQIIWCELNFWHCSLISDIEDFLFYSFQNCTGSNFEWAALFCSGLPPQSCFGIDTNWQKLLHLQNARSSLWNTANIAIK